MSCQIKLFVSHWRRYCFPYGFRPAQGCRLPKEIGLEHRGKQVERAALPDTLDRPLSASLGAPGVALEMSTDGLAHVMDGNLRLMGVLQLEVIDQEYQVGGFSTLPGLHRCHQLGGELLEVGRRIASELRFGFERLRGEAVEPDRREARIGKRSLQRAGQPSLFADPGCDQQYPYGDDMRTLVT